MARRCGVAVPLVALLLGLAAAALSFLAYSKRIRIEDVRTNRDGLCIYPSSASFAIGILAALLILIHQILISAGTGCLCCTRDRMPCNICGIMALILFVFSWISFVITFTGLIYTAVINDKSFLRSKNYMSHGNTKDDCLLGKETLFLGAAIWCVITVFFSMCAYVTFKCGVKAHRHHAKQRPNYGP